MTMGSGVASVRSAPMASAPRTLTTTYTEIEWSADGRTVTKTRRPAHDARRRYRYELRINVLPALTVLIYGSGRG